MNPLHKIESRRLTGSSQRLVCMSVPPCYYTVSISFFLLCFFLLICNAICLFMHIIMTIKATFHVPRWKVETITQKIMKKRMSIIAFRWIVITDRVKYIHLNSLFLFAFDKVTMWKRRKKIIPFNLRSWPTASYWSSVHGLSLHRQLANDFCLNKKKRGEHLIE